MRSRTEQWKEITRNGEFEVESVAVIDGKVYDAITAPVIKRGLFAGSTLSIGNCVSAVLTFTVMTTDTIARSAEVYIRYMLKSGNLTTSWVNCGPYWVNRRTVKDDLITLECYDAMLKGNQQYTDDSQTVEWPKQMKTVVARCATLMGVELDARNVIKDSSIYKTVTMPDANTSILTILGNIAGAQGGNWVITDDGKLRLVRITEPPAITVEWTEEMGLDIEDDQGNVILFPVIKPPAGVSVDDVVDVPVVINELTTGKILTISRVSMEIDSETGWTFGTNDGFELLVTDNPYVSEDICQALYDEVNGIHYVPYSVSNACYDPAAELGDYFAVFNRFGSILCEETRRLDIAFSADATAPSEEEVDNEFKYYGELQRIRDDGERIQKYAENVGRTLVSYIAQTDTRIETLVSDTTELSEKAIVAETILYYDSTNPTRPEGGSWGADPPTWREGRYIWTRTQYTYGDGSPGLTEPVCITGNTGGIGPKGNDGTSVSILGEFETVEELEQITGNPGDAYIVAGDLYVWSANTQTWVNVGRIQGEPGKDGKDGKDGQDGAPGKDGKDGEPGQDGEDAYYLYITSNGSTATPKEQTTTVYLTACVGKGNNADTDPNGTLYNYTWYVKPDNGQETVFGTGKTIQVTIGSGLCNDSALVRFALVGVNLTTENGINITNENLVNLEVG